MKAFILLLLIAMPLFSQKLWEIDVTGNGNLTDVREIPNSELLLFTYSTGRLEIRRGSDGSFVNQPISKPNERGGFRISNAGNLYFSQENSDTIEFRDIRTNESVMKISPIIDSLESNPMFDERYYKRCEIFDNNTRLFCHFIYIDNSDQRNNQGNIIIYNIVTRQIEYQRLFDVKSTDYYYSVIKESYMSPDGKYLIEIAYGNQKVRLFNLHTKVYEKELDGSISEDESYRAGALEYGRFQNNNLINVGAYNIFKSYSFPNLILLENIDVWDKSHFLISSSPSGLNVCGNIFVCNVHERKENQTTQYYRYYLKYNYVTGEIIYSSKNYQASLDYSAVFTYDNCSKVIIDRDYDNRDGIIACYDANTLDVIPQYPESNYFSKIDSFISFSSSEFIGQLATIDIYNSVGAKVGSLFNGIINQSNLQFQLQDLPSGAYHLQCQLNSTTLNFNFMVVI